MSNIVTDGDLDFEALMEDPPGGLNYGRADGSALSVEDAQTEEFLQQGGWTVTKRGVTTHTRGVISGHGESVCGDEPLDLAAVRTLVEKQLGFTYTQIEDAYRNGRPTTDRARTRARIDARLLALSVAGANMLALARVLGWPIEAGGSNGGASCRTMERALARARAAEAVAS